MLDAFNKDRASMPQPLQAPPPLAPLPFAPDARTQEMIKEKLKRAEELGWSLSSFCSFLASKSETEIVLSMPFLVGEEGRVDEAQRFMEEADALKKVVSCSHKSAKLVLYHACICLVS